MFLQFWKKKLKLTENVKVDDSVELLTLFLRLKKGLMYQTDFMKYTCTGFGLDMTLVLIFLKRDT